MRPAEHPGEEVARYAIEAERQVDGKTDPERQVDGRARQRFLDLRLRRPQRTPARQQVIEHRLGDLPELRQLVRVSRCERIARHVEAPAPPTALEAFVEDDVVTRLECVFPCG